MAGSRITWAALGLTAIGLVGCSTSAWTAKEMTPGAGEAANVLLYLSNQSSERPSVTMSVYVDGRLALRKTMRDVMAGGRHGFPEEFKLRLSPGPHTIRVDADGLLASESVEVVVGVKPWYVDASYDYWPNRHGAGQTGVVSIQVGGEPPGFC